VSFETDEELDELLTADDPAVNSKARRLRRMTTQHQLHQLADEELAAGAGSSILDSGWLPVLVFVLGLALELAQVPLTSLVLRLLPRSLMAFSMLIGTLKHLVMLVLCYRTLVSPFRVLFWDARVDVDELSHEGSPAAMLLLVSFACGTYVAELWFLVDRLMHTPKPILVERFAAYALLFTAVVAATPAKLVVYALAQFSTSLVRLTQDLLCCATVYFSRHFKLDLYIYGVRALLALSLNAVAYRLLSYGSLEFVFACVLVSLAAHLYKFYVVVSDWLQGEDEEYM
jgi:hypothetical protein